MDEFPQVSQCLKSDPKKSERSELSTVFENHPKMSPLRFSIAINFSFAFKAELLKDLQLALLAENYHKTPVFDGCSSVVFQIKYNEEVND